MLRTKHGIDLAKETVRRLQIAVGLWIPRKLWPPKIHQPRIRRACIGELVQIDGCEHHWFEDREPACTMHILFTGTESTFGHFEATRQYLAQHSSILLGATGQTINLMTLGGLALAVGTLVDDARVTLD